VLECLTKKVKFLEYQLEGKTIAKHYKKEWAWQQPVDYRAHSLN
jgi:hypothetical protein